MLDEDVILKDAKNASERFLLTNAMLMVLVPALFLGGESDATKTLFVALGILAPINVFTYRQIWIDAPTGTIRRYLLSLLPLFVSIAIYICGTFDSLLWESEKSSEGYFRLITKNPSLIVSASSSTLSSFISEFTMLSAAACAFSIFFITDSRYIIRRIFLFCAAGAAIFAMFGFLYKIPLLSKIILPIFGDDAFSTFKDSSQWSGFAIAWIGAALSIIIYSSQRYRLFTFLISLKFIAISIVAILLLSILVAGSYLDILLALILTSLGFILVCIDTIPTQENLERHYTSKYVHSKYKKLKLSVAPAFYFLIFVVTFVGAIFVTKSLVDSYDDKTNPVLVERANIKADAIQLVKERPIFGWGTASFKNVFAFRQGADFGDAPYSSPKSDLLKKLVENGYVGIFLLAISPFIFFVRWLVKFRFSKSGMVLCVATLSILILSIFEGPLQSAATLQSFWLLLITTFKWEDCEVR